MFRSPKDHPEGVLQALLNLPLCTINIYAFVGDVGACACGTAQPNHSIRHSSKEHTSTGRHGHNLIPNACCHVTYISVHVNSTQW